ncbi:MAG: helix-turn-helix transcriptional regulator [Candidatus Krumholzibacteriota bacterium]|nr:helix-turn-helix transcriptional regulator [Candidatus Krumholzibacteriota bacterium]
MTDRLMTTKELAAYLSLNEKKVYSLVKKGAIPFTRVTGKYLFPLDSVNRWIEESIIAASTGKSTGKITITGSHDPAIDLLVSEVNQRHSDITMLMASVGSTRGMEMLRDGRADMAGIHILDPDSSDYNLPWIEKNAPGLRPVVVHFAMRSQGLIVAKGNPLGIAGIEDIAARRLKFAGRQKGSGTRMLLGHLLFRAGLAESNIEMPLGEAATHTEIAQAVRAGLVDAGLGVQAAAIAARLDFINLTEESFDIAMSKRNFYSEPVQKCLDTVRSEAFRGKVTSMGGYDMKDSGSVISWG